MNALENENHWGATAMSFMLFEKKMKDFFSSHYVKLTILLQ